MTPSGVLTDPWAAAGEQRRLRSWLRRLVEACQAFEAGTMHCALWPHECPDEPAATTAPSAMAGAVAGKLLVNRVAVKRG